MADPTQMHQLVMDLSANAAHAMRETGGVLGVDLGRIEIDAQTAGPIPEMRAGSYVKLTIGDTGHGIEPRLMAHIFDPYFTTKEIGVGTGLGLAVVYGIVKQHDGLIVVNSEVGKGTVVEILFPQIGAGEVQPDVAESDIYPPGSESDGADRIRSIESAAAYIERVMTDDAFRDRVKAAADKEERIALVKAEGFDFDLEDIKAATAALSDDALGPIAQQNNQMGGERWMADIVFVGRITEGIFY